MGKMTIVGVGWERGQLTLNAIALLKSGASIVLHTERCGCADWLRDEGIPFETLDELYETSEDFDEHIEAAVTRLSRMAKSSDVVYAVADARDRTVSALLNALPSARVTAGPTDDGALSAYAVGAVQRLEASDWESYRLSAYQSAVIREIDSRALASEVKLKLMECYPEESPILVRFADGGIARTALYNLDRLKGYDHRACALVPAQRTLPSLERYDFEHLCEIMQILCGPDGCPWDREQTHESLRPYLVEEAYEVIGAIDEGDPNHLCDELGDMLLQVALHAEIARKHGAFNAGDVATAICEKMIARHSHIFGEDSVSTAAEVSELWARNKMAERGETTYAETLREVSKSMPAMMRASKVLKRLDAACRQREETEPARARAMAAINTAKDEKTLGDALLHIMALARALSVDPEIALNGAADRLTDRFEAAEKTLGKLDDADADTLKHCWDSVKL